MGLLDAFQGLGNLSPDQTQGLLAAAAQMLQQSGPSRTPTSFGQIVGGGLGAYQQGTDAARKRKLEEEQAAQLRQLRELDIQSQTGALQQQGSMREQQSAIDAAAQAAVRDGQFDQNAFINNVRLINPLKAAEFEQKFAKAAPEFDTKPQTAVGPDGKPFQYILAKNGEMKRLDGALPRDELKLANLGGKDVAYNPFALQDGQTFQRTQTPDSLASNAIQMRGQNMTDARAREANQISGGMRSDAQLQKVRDENLTKQGQIASFDTMLDSLDRLNQSPGLSRSVGLYSKIPTIPGSDSANFQAELETFKSQAFLPQVAQLKGMGALSDAEGKKLSAAVGALDPSMSEKAFRESINRIKSTMDTARERVVNSSREIVQQGAAPQRTQNQPARKSVMQGQVIDGYRFKGGDPSQQANWEKQ